MIEWAAKSSTLDMDRHAFLRAVVMELSKSTQNMKGKTNSAQEITRRAPWRVATYTQAVLVWMSSALDRCR